MQHPLLQTALDLLQALIAIPSFSREEGQTADLLEHFFAQRNCCVYRSQHNVWAFLPQHDPQKPTILLNSHHDTVKPQKSWTKDPFTPVLEGDILYGLGSNDAGGPLVSLIATFLHYHDREDLPYNLIIACTAEEEISGPNGIQATLPQLGAIDIAIVGEPTSLKLAVAEKGLMVIDGEAKGVSGHAAREEGTNALYIALADIQWLKQYVFSKSSPLLGPNKISVTQIQAGSQHNVVPDRCSFVIDVRTNECYHNEEVFQVLDQHTQSSLKARSFRLNSSGIDLAHPLVQKAQAMGLETYGSPTLSDQALMRIPSVKLGPGQSARSHTADEFILVSEINAGIQTYIQLLDKLQLR